MSDKTWKSRERRVSKLFGGRRNPLSGRHGGHTSGDVVHGKYYIEVKYRKKMPFYSLWEEVKSEAKKEGKIPVLALCESGKKGFLVVIHSDYLKEFQEMIQ